MSSLYERSSDLLEQLRGLFDLSEVPFTDRGSRILVFQGEGNALDFGIVGFLAGERPPAAVRVWFLADDGAVRPLQSIVGPDRVDLLIGDQAQVMTFVDDGRLIVGLPIGRTRLVLETQKGAVPLLMDRGLRVGQAIGESIDITFTGNPEISINGGTATVSIDEAGENSFWAQLTVNDDPIQVDGERSMAQILSESSERWVSHLLLDHTSPPTESLSVATALWVLAANTVRLGSGREMQMPAKSFYQGLWGWDSYFHAFALSRFVPEMARTQLRILLDNQLPDGQLPDAVGFDGRVIAHSRDVPSTSPALLPLAARSGNDHIEHPGAPLTKPPLAPWAVWKLHERCPSREFLEETYQRLVASHQWWFDRSDPDGDGLPDYLHPYSSGLDNNPLFDGGGWAGPPDLPAYLARGYDALAAIADVLERPSEAATWRSEAERIVALLIDLRWDSRQGRFRTVGVDDAPQTPLELMPLFTGRLPAAIADRLVARLTDPAKFWPRYPVPSVAVDEAKFDPISMCRGPTWVNINYLLIDGLEKSGYFDVAVELKRRTIDLLSSNTGMFEFYNPLSGRPPATAARFFSWTAAVFLDLSWPGSNSSSAE
ncbi:MAG: amylo-alpha-1,6-glucosidase [Acidimicrobiia bacterium]